MSTRVLLAAPPFAGHLNPLLFLGTGLRDLGFEIMVATGASKAPYVRNLGFTTHALFPDDPDVFDRIANTPGPVRSNPLLLKRQLAANLALIPQARKELDAILRDHKPDVVIADFTAPVAGMSAQEQGIPWITTIPTPFALETRHGTPSYCGGWGPATHRWHRTRDAAGRTATRVVKRAMQRLLAASFRAAGARIYREDGSEAAYSPTTILGLGMSELEFPRDWPEAFEMIGPVTASPQVDIAEPQLPNGRLVLVTLGTHLPWAKRDLLGRVQRLAAKAPEFTFIVSLGDMTKPATLVERENRVFVYGSLDYDEVLSRCEAVIHHGGAGIAYSSIRAGVPALVVPHDYDQFDFTARLTAAGAAVRIRRIESSADQLRAAVRDDRNRLRTLSKSVELYDPIGSTAQAISRELERVRRV